MAWQKHLHARDFTGTSAAQSTWRQATASTLHSWHSAFFLQVNKEASKSKEEEYTAEI